MGVIYRLITRIEPKKANPDTAGDTAFIVKQKQDNQHQTMYKGSSKIAKQLGERGIYGQIELTCVISGKNHGIDIVLPDTLEQWKTAVLAGADYFMEHSATKGQLFVTVNDIHYNPVDTNKIVITFLTVLALADAFGTKMPSAPFFDHDSIAFVFPK